MLVTISSTKLHTPILAVLSVRVALKSPPTYRSVPLTTIALTSLLRPLPRACHEEPSHLAMWLHPTVVSQSPAVVNPPPTYTSVPLTAIASASSSRPRPDGYANL